jgi:hypothetical protein
LPPQWFCRWLLVFILIPGAFQIKSKSSQIVGAREGSTKNALGTSIPPAKKVANYLGRATGATSATSATTGVFRTAFV